ncbi:hypothetical protein [Kineosporia sp. NBRC 101731]|uniref:hypothetical protein n=1 Tax=Kineosporia sp. NBRC 101731 TaxID=3032199 RepID=UPI0024A16355|nr:hypothetical protein [Kineosporia sp. NBRC 101731]GLY32699.1 hypothetical protein Kisp02_60640 [Kineosporia sp. NBRC 101731]
MLGTTAAVPLAGLLLAACTSAPVTSEPHSAFGSGPVPTVSSTWDVDPDQDAAWTAELDDIETTMTKIWPAVEDDRPVALTAYADLIDRTNDVLYDMATTVGVAGIGHVACEVLPVQMISIPHSYTPEQTARNLGIFWARPIAATGVGEAGSFADAQFDTRTREQCPDVHQLVLEAAGLSSLDDLYEYARAARTSESPAPEVI